MLHWFVRQKRIDKIAVLLAAAVVVPVAWTAIASYLLISLMGAWTRQHYPFSELSTYWQWWAFFYDAAQPIRIHKWLALSGVAAALPFVAFIVRQVMDYPRDISRSPVYGKTQWASRDQMKSGSISTTRRPF